MRKFIFILLAISIPALGQSLRYVPPPVAGFISTNGSGAAGTWNPLTGSGGLNALLFVPPAQGLYYSNDGTGNVGTWVPCTSVCGSGGAATSVPFSGVTSGTNLGQGLVCGNGCVLTPAGTGVISANEINGVIVSPYPLRVGYAPFRSQTTAIVSPPALFTATATAQYLVNSSINCDAIAVGATVQVTINFTDPAGNSRQSIPAAVACTTITGVTGLQTQQFSWQVQTGTAVTYSVAITGSPTYDFTISAIQMGAN